MLLEESRTLVCSCPVERMTNDAALSVHTEAVGVSGRMVHVVDGSVNCVFWALTLKLAYLSRGVSLSSAVLKLKFAAGFSVRSLVRRGHSRALMMC